MEKQTPLKPKILFVYDMDPEKEKNWKDGLWAALKILEEDFNFPINLRSFGSRYLNINKSENSWKKHLLFEPVDFVLGWGGFGSSVDNFIQTRKELNLPEKYGLCLGGYGFPARGIEKYDVIFYETEWSKKWIKDNSDSPELPRLIHAFGINANIYTDTHAPKIWDYVTVGAFSSWKRQEKLLNKLGYKMAVGEIQKENMSESMGIISQLMMEGVVISDMTSPESLAKIYNASFNAYIPATTFGGGERAVLEARACGTHVEVELDNPKLQELLTCPVWDHHYYAEQLKKGIMLCL